MDTIERRVGDLTVRIDRLLCVGFADCLDEAPGAFVLDDEGIAAFADPDLALSTGYPLIAVLVVAAVLAVAQLLYLDRLTIRIGRD